MYRFSAKTASTNPNLGRLLIIIAGLALFMLLTFLPTTYSQAAGQDGALDATFKNGIVLDEDVLAMVQQSDGKIVLGGRFTYFDSAPRNRITRLNATGSLDKSFNPGSGANGAIYAIGLQDDGKILIGGAFTAYNGSPRNNLARLNADGSLDNSFLSAGDGANSTVLEIKQLQNNGKILIGGDFTGYNGTAINRIARLNADGSLDSSFNSGTGFDKEVDSIAVQADGKIVIAGFFTDFNGVSRNRIAGLNADGSLDSSFNPGVGTGNNSTSYGFVVNLQNDGKILFGGFFDSYNNTPCKNAVRLNADGSLDTCFNIKDWGARVRAIELQNDGKILIGGGVNMRLNADGSIDTSFISAISDRDTTALVIQSDNKIVLSSMVYASDYNWGNHLVRLNPNGSLDGSFNPVRGANNIILSLALQNDNKIIASGGFTTYNDVQLNRIARLNPDGELDTSFNPGEGANDYVWTTQLQNDGKILIGGKFTAYNGISRNRIARLNPDGSLDSSFNPGSGGSNVVQAIQVQNDGKILIGGFFTTYNNTFVGGLARLNPDGSLDSSFNKSGSSSNIEVIKIALQNDGKIVIIGNFTSYNGVGRMKVARLNSDGSLDFSFNPNSNIDPALTLTSLVVQNDGKVIISGSKYGFSSKMQKKIIRLNLDGSLDTSFNPAEDVFIFAGGYAYDIVLQNDGRLILVGDFFQHNGADYRGIIRLNTDGSFDTSFKVGAGTIPGNVFIHAAKLQNDGKLLLGGNIILANNYSLKTLARLELVTKETSSVTLTSSPNPSSVSQNVTFTATVTPQAATGTVTFTFGSNLAIAVPLVNGVASYITNTLAAGATEVRATYSGDATYVLSGSPLYTQTVTKLASSVEVISSPNPSQFNQSVTFTATVAPVTASGLVTFTFDNLTTVTNTLINGVATYPTNTLAVGTHQVKATYGGDAYYFASTSEVYTQIIVANCNPALVTDNQDDGQATTCGTFSYALATTSSGTISFALGASNTIIFSQPLTPTLKPGVAVDGGAGIFLNGNGHSGDGLRLGGNNHLTNLTIRGFGGRGLVATLGASASILYRVKVES